MAEDKLTVVMTEECQIEKFDDILFGLHFVEDVLESDPNRCWITDGSELWHFGVHPNKTKNKLFYKYGYRQPQDYEYITPSKLNEDDKQILYSFVPPKNNTLLWQDLAQIKENLQVHIPLDLNAFWAVPSRLCISHSHPNDDVFCTEHIVRNIAETKFDVIIELRTNERVENKNMFAEIMKENDLQVQKIEFVIPEDAEFAFEQINSIITQIDNFLAEDKRILFHSQGRTNRLGLVLASFLLKHKLALKKNFINKINELREGLWSNEDPTIQFEYWDFNQTQLYNCDRSRHYFKSKYLITKPRSSYVVPFYFNKKMINSIEYSVEDLALAVDYKVDKKTSELLSLFKNMKE